MKPLARTIERIAVVAASVVLAASVYQRYTAPRITWTLSTEQQRELREQSGHRLVFPGVFRDTIVLFLNYQCGLCAALYPELVRADAAYGVVVRHLTGDRGSSSTQAAIAAECARREDRIHAYSYALFAKRDSIGLLAWEEFGRVAGMEDFARFSRCIENHDPLELVDADTRLGISLGLTGTPAAILHGRVHLGGAQVESMLRELNGRSP